MGKLMLSINITRDGSIADQDGGLAWHLPFWDHQMSELLSKLLSNTEMLLLGKNTYQSFIAFWPERASNFSLSRSDIVLTEIFNDLQKVVVSKQLKTTQWNATLLHQGLRLQEIKKLKNKSEGKILVLGSISLAKVVFEAGLFDDIILWEHPIHLQTGTIFFEQYPFISRDYQLLSVTKLDSGVKMNHFQRL